MNQRLLFQMNVEKHFNARKAILCIIDACIFELPLVFKLRCFCIDVVLMNETNFYLVMHVYFQIHFRPFIGFFFINIRSNYF